MALTIVVRTGEAGSPPAVTFDAPRVVVGRGASCDVCLPDPSVSQRHASIRQRGTDYIIVDEGSSNGTFVGPVRLSPHAPRVIVSGDLVRMGRIWLEVRIDHHSVTCTTGAATKELALSLVKSTLAADGEAAVPYVSVVEGPDTGTTLELSQFDRPYVVGRAKSSDLVVVDVDASRRHLELVLRGSRLYVRDLGSKNGTLLGNASLLRDRPTWWSEGAVLAVGADRLVFRDPVREALAELEQMADEHMRDDEWIESPPIEARVPSGSEVEQRTGPRNASPMAAPSPRQAKRRIARTDGWSGTDVIVLFLALAVIAASLLGLFWLFDTP
jgi:pSer/pThr/pTyr-binding forkhead associated (FHA) protein